MRSVICFVKKGKPSPRYVGPFQVKNHVNPMAYKLELPPSLDVVHGVFHVLQLRRCIHDHFTSLITSLLIFNQTWHMKSSQCKLWIAKSNN
jgi:hypothetical protein